MTQIGDKTTTATELAKEAGMFPLMGLLFSLMLLGGFFGIILLLIPRLRFLASHVFFIPTFAAVAGFCVFFGGAFLQEYFLTRGFGFLRVLLNLVLLCLFPLGMLGAAAGGFLLAQRINRFFTPPNDN